MYQEGLISNPSYDLTFVDLKIDHEKINRLR